MTRPALLAIAVLFVATLAHDCNAQRRATSRVPNYLQSPTISPYVNLFNNNQGGVNNYFSFVRPMQRQQQINQFQFNQSRMMQRQMTQPGQSSAPVIIVGSDVQGMLRPSAAGMGQPAAAATFFNYSHFYSAPTSGFRGR